MLREFAVSGYRCFCKEVSLRFPSSGRDAATRVRMSAEEAARLLLIGAPGSGKTCLGLGLMDIRHLLQGGAGVSAEMGGQSDQAADVFFTSDNYFYQNSPQRAASFRYVFQHGPAEIVYEYTKVAPERLAAERLTVDRQLMFERRADSLLWGRCFLPGLERQSAVRAGIEPVLRRLAVGGSDGVDPEVAWLVRYVRGMRLLTDPIWAEGEDNRGLEGATLIYVDVPTPADPVRGKALLQRFQAVPAQQLVLATAEIHRADFLVLWKGPVCCFNRSRKVVRCDGDG